MNWENLAYSFWCILFKTCWYAMGPVDFDVHFHHTGCFSRAQFAALRFSCLKVNITCFLPWIRRDLSHCQCWVFYDQISYHRKLICSLTVATWVPGKVWSWIKRLNVFGLKHRYFWKKSIYWQKHNSLRKKWQFWPKIPFF